MSMRVPRQHGPRSWACIDQANRIRPLGPRFGNSRVGYVTPLIALVMQPRGSPAGTYGYRWHPAGGWTGGRNEDVPQARIVDWTARSRPDGRWNRRSASR